MLDITRAPKAISDLVEWFAANGFSVTEERTSGHNNQYAAFTDGNRTVKVTVSRGEWSLGIGLRDKTVHPEQWEAWLGGYPLADELYNLDHQVGFIIHRWQAAVERARLRPEAEEEIRNIGDDWVERRFGFRPPKS